MGSKEFEPITKYFSRHTRSEIDFSWCITSQTNWVKQKRQA
jgi:hypothetical protein